MVKSSAVGNEVKVSSGSEPRQSQGVVLKPKTTRLSDRKSFLYNSEQRRANTGYTACYASEVSAGTSYEAGVWVRSAFQ